MIILYAAIILCALKAALAVIKKVLVLLRDTPFAAHGKPFLVSLASKRNAHREKKRQTRRFESALFGIPYTFFVKQGIQERVKIFLLALPFKGHKKKVVKKYEHVSYAQPSCAYCWRSLVVFLVLRRRDTKLRKTVGFCMRSLC